MLRPIRLSLLTLTAALLVAAPAAAGSAPFPGDGHARAGAVPSNFVKHEGQYWSWYGPANWVASYGAYGITITSPVGDDVIDFGASSIFCDGSPDEHFASARKQIKAAIALQKVRFRNVSAVRQVGNSFVQTFDWTGQKRNGKVTRGEFELSYAAVDAQYCFQSTLTKYAPDNRGYSKAIKVLRAVWANTFYFGPGV